jgi:hypothetical protein
MKINNVQTVTIAIAVKKKDKIVKIVSVQLKNNKLY